MNKRQRERRRILYLVLTIVTIFLGLASRRYAAYLPAFLAEYAGDALWAMMIFWGAGFLFVRTKTRTNAALALLFCYMIEISQLYQADWINHIRATTLGGLVLGYGFLWSDLVCYTTGVLISTVLEVFLFKRKRR